MAGGGGTPSDTHQTTKVELPAWLTEASEQNFNRASDLVQNKQYQSYTGDRIAGPTADNDWAAAQIRDMQGQTSGALQGLGDASAQFGNWQPSQVTPNMLAGMDLTPYMNPYTGEVEANALKALESTRQQAQQGIGDQFLSSKAFGGSRQALQSAVTDAQTAQKAAETSAQLRQANYNQAVAGATGDITRGMTAQTANQTAGLQGAQLNLAGLKQAGDMYGAGQKADIASIGLLDTLGQQDQSRTQAQLDINYQNWLESQGYDKSQIEWLGQMLASSPGSQTTTVNTTGTPGGSRASPMMGALGGAASGAAMGSMIAPGYGTAIGAVAGGLLGGLSSR
jgi:hypothetical protein